MYIEICNAAVLNLQTVQYGRMRVISEDVQAIMDGDDIKIRKHLRLEVQSFTSILGMMREKYSGWSKEYELMIFLYWMAAGCSYRVAGGFVGISRYTVKRIVHKMLDFFCTNMRHIIHHCDPSDFESVSLKFCRRAKTSIFANAIGAIDGTHNRISCPVKKHDEYMNYKGFYSIQCQAIMDSNFLFNDVFIGYPGSVHDTRV